MYPMYFYVCLLASLASMTILILLAIFPLKLPLVPKAHHQLPSTQRNGKARSPTHPKATFPAWDAWNDDNEDL